MFKIILHVVNTILYLLQNKKQEGYIHGGQRMKIKVKNIKYIRKNRKLN